MLGNTMGRKMFIMNYCYIRLTDGESGAYLIFIVRCSKIFGDAVLVQSCFTLFLLGLSGIHFLSAY